MPEIQILGGDYKSCTVHTGTDASAVRFFLDGGKRAFSGDEVKFLELVTQENLARIGVESEFALALSKQITIGTGVSKNGELVNLFIVFNDGSELMGSLGANEYRGILEKWESQGIDEAYGVQRRKSELQEAYDTRKTAIPGMMEMLPSFAGSVAVLFCFAAAIGYVGWRVFSFDWGAGSGSCGASNGQAMATAQTFVRQRLKSPSSARFPSGTRGVSSTSDCRYTVRSYVDAQNGFGAELRTHYVVRMERLTSQRSWRLISIDM